MTGTSFGLLVLTVHSTAIILTYLNTKRVPFAYQHINICDTVANHTKVSSRTRWPSTPHPSQNTITPKISEYCPTMHSITSKTPMHEENIWVPTKQEREIEDSSRLVTLSSLFKKDVSEDSVFITEVPRSEKSFFVNYKYVAHCGLSKNRENMVAIRITMPHRILPFMGHSLKVFSSVKPPEILVRHWERKLGPKARPRFASLTKTGNTTYVCPYPIEQLPFSQQHVDPDSYYKMLSKRFVSKVPVTQPEIFTDVTVPCVIKLTHGMGGTAVFLVTNETELWATKLKIENTHPDADVIVTEMITGLESPEYSAHFFVDKSGNVTWWEVVELIEDENGHAIGTMWTKNNTRLRHILEPFVFQVAKALHQNGYFGPAGCDVLHDGQRGYLVDINPRITCSMPMCLMAKEMERRGWSVGVMTRQRLLDISLDTAISRADSITEGDVLLLSAGELKEGGTLAYVAVFSDSRETCERIIKYKLPIVCANRRSSQHSGF